MICFCLFILLISKVYVLKYQSVFETQVKINTIHHSARLKQKIKTKHKEQDKQTKITHKNF